VRRPGRDERDHVLAVEQVDGLAGRGLFNQCAQLRFGLADDVNRYVSNETRMRLDVNGEAKAGCFLAQPRLMGLLG